MPMPAAENTPGWIGAPHRSAAGSAASARVPPASAGSAKPEGRTVLIAEDNRDAADTLAELLRLFGHTVDIAYNGLQAAEMAEKLHPQVMVFDIGMPGINGYELAHRIRAQAWAQQAFLIATTGWGQVNDRDRALGAGFDMHFTKPVDGLALNAVITAGMRRPGS